MDPSSINAFDAVIGSLALIAAVMGFATGLLRSMATIIGYVAAAPAAVALTPVVTQTLATRPDLPQVPDWGVFGILLLGAGMVLGALMRRTVGLLVGTVVGLPDRLAGAMLGVGRIGLVAVAMVLIFDRLVPVHLQPRYLTESRLHPYLSAAAAAGVKSLPPEAETLIDRLRRDHGL